MYQIRKVRPEDKAEVLAISSKIWDGDDYIPRLFDDWVKEKKGEFTAVLNEGKIIGFGKLTYLTDTDIWLEGLRSDLDSPHRGVGKTLTEYYLKKLRRKKRITSVRSSSYYQNAPSRRVSESAGFKQILTLSNKSYEFQVEEKEEWLKRISDSNRSIPTKHPVSFNELCGYLESSRFMRLISNFLFLAWTGYPYSRKVIRKLFYTPKQYLIEMDDDRIKGLILYDTRFSLLNYTSLPFIEAEDDEVAKSLFEKLKEITVREDQWYIETKIPNDEKIHELIGKLGLKSWEQENDFLVYEKSWD